MSCNFPLRAERKDDGAVVLGGGRTRGSGAPLLLPCGKCTGCLAERARMWAVRIMQEARLHDRCCWVTLTYADEHLPPYGSLCVGDFQRFMKRLRKYASSPVRFFHCGEYGARYSRPHYHAILFGFDFPDKVFVRERGGFAVYSSVLLSRLWPSGRTEIGTLEFAAAAYVARYVVKKLSPSERERVNLETGEVVVLDEEYVTMSRRPGIGAGFFERYRAEIARDDAVLCDGRLVRPPRYYDKLLAKGDPELAEAVRLLRLQKERQRYDERRLEAREEVLKARLNLYRRELE